MRALSRCELAGFDAFAKPHQFGDRDVERFLGAFGGGAGVAEDGGAVALGVERGVNGVAEAALLADFGEEPRAGSAGEDADRRPGLEVVGMLVGDRRVGDADVRLGRLEGNVIDGRFAVHGFRGRIVARLPIAEELFDVVAEFLPVEVTGHGHDRVVGAVALGVKLADVVDRDGAERFFVAVAGAAPGVGIAAAAELDHQLLARLIINGPQFLQAGAAAGFELVGGEQRPANQIGEELEGCGEIVAERGAAEGGLGRADRFAAFDAEVFQFADPGAAIARAGAAEHHFARERCEAGAGGGVVRAAARQQEGEGGRFERLGRLADEDHAVRESM